MRFSATQFRFPAAFSPTKNGASTAGSGESLESPKASQSPPGDRPPPGHHGRTQSEVKTASIGPPVTTLNGCSYVLNLGTKPADKPVPPRIAADYLSGHYSDLGGAVVDYLATSPRS